MTILNHKSTYSEFLVALNDLHFFHLDVVFVEMVTIFEKSCLWLQLIKAILAKKKKSKLNNSHYICLN